VVTGFTGERNDAGRSILTIECTLCGGTREIDREKLAQPRIGHRLVSESGRCFANFRFGIAGDQIVFPVACQAVAAQHILTIFSISN
jgi:hypothetical protein